MNATDPNLNNPKMIFKDAGRQVMAPKTFLCPRPIYIYILAEIIAAFPWRRSESGPCGVPIADGESMPEHH